MSPTFKRKKPPANPFNPEDARGTDEVTCPHFGHEQSDSYEYFDRSGDMTEIECTNEDCGKTFLCEERTSVSY